MPDFCTILFRQFFILFAKLSTQRTNLEQPGRKSKLEDNLTQANNLKSSDQGSSAEILLVFIKGNNTRILFFSIDVLISIKGLTRFVLQFLLLFRQILEQCTTTVEKSNFERKKRLTSRRQIIQGAQIK